MTVKEWIRFNSNFFNDSYLSIAVEVVKDNDDGHILSAEINTFKNLELIFGDYEILSIFPDGRGSIVITLKRRIEDHE